MPLWGHVVRFFEELRDAAPADVFRQDLLFVGRGDAAIGLDLFERADGLDVAGGFFSDGSFADMIGVGYAVVGS